MRTGPRQYRTVSQGTARAFVILAAVAVIIAGASSWLAVRAVQGEIRSRASVVQLCRAGNEARAQQVTLWTHLVQISAPPPHQTAAQKTQRARTIAAFLAYVRHVFAARDCSHYSGG